MRKDRIRAGSLTKTRKKEAHMVGTLLMLGILSILIISHEFGHFIFAKIFGVGVQIFSFGFGKILYKRKIGETEYALSAIPLGGYVKMEGEMREDQLGSNSHKMYFAKPVWQRMLIIAAGPLFNFILAFGILAGIALAYKAPSLAIPEAMSVTTDMITKTVNAVWGLLTGSISIQNIGGPIGVAQASGRIMAKDGLEGVLFLAALLSINLGVLNLLPIPPLDGGHLPLLALEAIRRKPLSQGVEMRVKTAGVIFMLSLMILGTIFDISRFFG